MNCKNCELEDEYCVSGDCPTSQSPRNDLATKPQVVDLTEQWKKGELPDGYYYCKLILNNMKPSVERCKAHCIPMGVSADKGEEVLAPVPSYEEWKEKIEENARLKERVSKLEKMQYSYTPEEWNTMLRTVNRTKELLKECKPYIGYDTYEFDEKVNKLLTKIDEALR